MENNISGIDKMKYDIKVTDNHDGYIINSKDKVPPVTKIIKETVGIGWEAGQWYLDRGTAVHACAKLIADGKRFTHDPQIDGYVEGIYKFFREVKPEVKYSELPVYSHLYKFAGTIDLVAKIRGLNGIFDYKNSLDLERLKLQLGAYKQGLIETVGLEVKFGFGIVLDGKGNYKLTKRIILNSREFLALRTTYAIWDRLGLLNKDHLTIKEGVNNV